MSVDSARVDKTVSKRTFKQKAKEDRTPYHQNCTADEPFPYPEMILSLDKLQTGDPQEDCDEIGGKTEAAIDEEFCKNSSS